MSRYARTKSAAQKRRDAARWFDLKLKGVESWDRINNRPPRAQAPAYLNPHGYYAARHEENVRRHPRQWPREAAQRRLARLAGVVGA